MTLLRNTCGRMSAAAAARVMHRACACRWGAGGGVKACARAGTSWDPLLGSSRSLTEGDAADRARVLCGLPLRLPLRVDGARLGRQDVVTRSCWSRLMMTQRLHHAATPQQAPNTQLAAWHGFASADGGAAKAGAPRSATRRCLRRRESDAVMLAHACCSRAVAGRRAAGSAAPRRDSARAVHAACGAGTSSHICSASQVYAVQPSRSLARRRRVGTRAIAWAAPAAMRAPRGAAPKSAPRQQRRPAGSRSLRRWRGPQPRPWGDGRWVARRGRYDCTHTAARLTRL